MGLAATGPQFLATLPLLALMGFFGPAAQALATRRIGPSDQGRLQGANAATMGIAGLVGPGLFTTIFAASLDTAPGAAFLVASALVALGLAIAAGTTRAA